MNSSVTAGEKPRINSIKTQPTSKRNYTTNKLVAKMANAFGKSRQPKDKPPNSIMIVPPGEEKLFLKDLPVGKLWRVGVEPVP